MVFVGRSTERDRLRVIVADSCDGGSVIVRGPAGIGKTTLIDEVLATFGHEIEIVCARGIPSEVRVPFAGLSELLSPLLDRCRALPSPQRDALENALAIGGGSGGGPLAVAMATVSLLSSRDDSRRPIVAVVDDAQWLDAESRECITFAVRRAAGRFTMVLAVRSDEDTWIPPDVETLDLGPLSTSDADALARETAHGFPPHVRTAIVKAAGGNPLALVQIPKVLGPHGGLATIDDLLASANAVMPSRLFDSRLDALDPEVRHALLVAAASGAESAAPVVAICGGGGRSPSLEEAEAAGLVALTGDAVRFTHPLLRAAVYNRATPTQRRQAHRRLAEVVTGDDRAWHLAAASVGPNAEAADALEAAARTSLERRATWLATDTFIRAAALTPPDGPRAARLASGAETAQLAGRTGIAAELAAEILAVCEDPAARLDALMVAAIGLSLSGQGMEADAVEGEIRRLSAVNPAKATFALALMGSLRFYRFDLAAARIDFELAESFSGLRLPECRAILQAARGDRHGARAELSAELAGDTPVLDVGWKWRALLMEDHTELVSRIRDEDTQAQIESGEYKSVPLNRFLEGWVAVHEGRFADARSLLDQSKEFSDLTGHTVNGMLAVATRARLLAATGDIDRARSELEPLRDPRGNSVPWFVVIAAQSALGFVELSAGDPRAAVVALRLARAYSEEHETEDPTLTPWSFDLVEALVRVGELEEAREVTKAFDTRAEFSGSTSAKSLSVCCAAVVASACDDAAFELALEIDAKSPRPFEAARIRLLWGARLHRDRRRAEARVQLRAALEAFESRGATPWANRARIDLDAAGGGGPRRTKSSNTLTAQESDIAQRASTGATVKTIASQLYLSPKTVEGHLASVYRKLGVQTRVALAERLRSMSEGE